MNGIFHTNLELSKIKNHFIKALFIIYNLISETRNNEFLTTDLAAGLNLSVHKITDKIISKLKKIEFISIVENPMFKEPKGNAKVYCLNKKGVECIDSLLHRSKSD